MAPGIVGRERELDLADAYLASLHEDARSLVLEGAAGIGKTAVWSTAVERGAARGHRVLTCRPEETEAQLSFVGLGDLVGEAAGPLLPSLPAPQRHALESALLRGQRGGRAPDPRTVAVGLRSLLDALSRTSPLVVAVDDLQWLDPPTARALAFALRRLGGRPVGLLATVRPGLDPHGLQRALGDRLSRLELGPLGAPALRRLLEGRLERPLPRPVLLRIVEASGGNPLFALEIARAFAASAVADPGSRLPLPESLRELVVTRIERLPRAGRQALLAAAALSRPTVELVEACSSPAGLAAAEEAGLVVVAGERIGFAHPLFASAVYSTAATRRRRTLHGRLAGLVSDPEQRARHLALAAEGPSEVVAAALEDAAELARSRGAWDAAGELLELAQRLTPSAHAEAARRRGTRAAEHHVHAGDRPRARALLEQVLAETPSGSPRAEALRLLAEVSLNDENFASARTLFAEALEHAADQRLAVTIELGLSYVHANLWQFEAGAADAERARARAEAIGDPALVAAALAYCAMMDYLRGRGADRRQVERALELEDPDLVVPLLWRPSTIDALLLLYMGRFGEARVRLLELRARMIEIGDESDLALLVFWLAWLETMSGDFDAAVAFADEAASLASLTGSDSAYGWVLTQRAFARAHRGEVEETRGDCEAAAELVERTGYALPAIWMAAALGLLELSLGDPAAAWRACAPLTELVEAQGIGEPVAAFYLPEAIEALVALGELDRAEALLERFEERAQALDRVWALARGARCRALLCAARGDAGGAEAALERALAEHERIELPFELARTQLVQGQLRRRRRQKRAARESLEAALAAFERLRATLWADLARGEIARLGLRRAPAELTQTEERAATLAAAGMTNREIAAALFVSPRTVQANLARAYAKLGVRSRAELGARMVTRERLQT